MDNSQKKSYFLLLLASAIWGFAFVAQRVGMQYMQPMGFNAVRFGLGALVLVPLLFFGFPGKKPQPILKGSPQQLLRAGLMTGLFIFAGSTFQQSGMVYTTAGKAGFITGLYVIFVPLIGLFRGLKTKPTIWVGAALGSLGLFLLSGKGWGGIALGDGLVLVGTLFWASHVLAVGYWVHKVNPLALAILQFIICSILSTIGAFFFESFTLEGLQNSVIPILYAGIMSVGVAYTLQILGQRKAHPAHAALILSLEGVFAALGGWILLSEGLTVKGAIGCSLMLGGIVLAQIGPRTPRKSSGH